MNSTRADHIAHPLPPVRVERQTEDDMALRELGGVKGDARLPPAPMTGQRRKKTPASNDDPGHTA